MNSGENTSGKIRQAFANNTNKIPYISVKHYIPEEFASNSKEYKYPPRIVIRSELELLQGLKIVALSDVKDPETNNSVKWWSCKVKHKRLQEAWNDSTVEERKALYKFIKKESKENGGFVNWQTYIGDFREPASVNSIIDVNAEPNYNVDLN